MAKRRNILVTIALILLIFASSIIVFFYEVGFPSKIAPNIKVGIETGWNSSFEDCRELIDKVKSYTNLFIIASPLILSDEAQLNKTCDYAYSAGMYFMPAYYTDIFDWVHQSNSSNRYLPSLWFSLAKQRYGDKLLGIYFYDEPAGNQLDENLDLTSNNIYNLTVPPTSYQNYADWFYTIWQKGNGVAVAANFTRGLNSSLFTSDYALYWFDYKLGYDKVFAQFAWNNSRQMQISLVRGAAKILNKDWGVTITWTFDRDPYLETADKMFEDMVFAYNSGADFISIYDSSLNYTSTTLTGDHFKALKDFWNYIQNNRDNHGSLKADTAVTLPKDYGFGFRSENDSVWQYHKVETWTNILYNDISSVISQHKSNVDIFYYESQFTNTSLMKYSKILSWPKDFSPTNNYTVVNQDNWLGFDNVQEAISSYATYSGNKILIQPNNYNELLIVTKPFVAVSQTNATKPIENVGERIALFVVNGQVTITPQT